MPTKKRTSAKRASAIDRGFRSPPWRVSHEVVERVAKMTEKLPMSASEVARQALELGLNQIEKIITDSATGIEVAARLGKTGTGRRVRGGGR